MIIRYQNMSVWQDGMTVKIYRDGKPYKEVKAGKRELTVKELEAIAKWYQIAE